MSGYKVENYINKAKQLVDLKRQIQSSMKKSKKSETEQGRSLTR